MRKLLIILLAAAVLAGGTLAWRARTSSVQPEEPPPAAEPAQPPAPAASPVAAPVPEPAVPPVSGPAADLAGAEALAKAGKGEEAAALYGKVLGADPEGAMGKKAAGALADHHAARKQPRKALGYRLRSDLSPQARQAAEAEARETAAAVLGPAVGPEDIQVTVAAGDTLAEIASKHGTTAEFIQRVNGISDPRRIVAGQRLKVVKGSLRILVEKGARRLTLLLDGVPIRTYTVGIGSEGRTPTAVFRIEEKLKEPPWTPPGRNPLPYGHPENILGTRWMGFNRTEQHTGFGIHGTTKDDTIGQASSNGCVRMHNAGVEELFDLVPRGTVVEISD